MKAVKHYIVKWKQLIVLSLIQKYFQKREYVCENLTEKESLLVIRKYFYTENSVYRHPWRKKKEKHGEGGYLVNFSASYNDNRYSRCHNHRDEKGRGRKRGEFVVVLTSNRKLISPVHQTLARIRLSGSPKRNAELQSSFSNLSSFLLQNV